MIKKRILICTIIALIAGGFGIKSFISFKQSDHSTEKHEYYYNNDSMNEEDASMSPDLNSNKDSDLPSRNSVDTTSDSIYCLVNKEYPLPSDYIPEDLVVPDITFNITYNAEKKYLRAIAADAIEKLFAAAAEENYQLCGVSGYRSYARQQEIYNNNISTKGEDHTNKYSAQPGKSEHQTGLAMDVSSSSIGYSLSDSFGETDEGKWLAANCYKYGFIIRYPKGKEDITGYAYEPWHIRYVGIPLATYLFNNDMVLEEYYNIQTRYNTSAASDETTVDVDENDLSSNTPATSSAPATQKSSTPSPTPSDDVTPTQSNSSSLPSESSPKASTEPETTTKDTTTTPSQEPSTSPSAKASASPSPKASATASPKASASISPSPSEKVSASPTPSTSPSPSPEDSEEPTETEDITSGQ